MADGSEEEGREAGKLGSWEDERKLLGIGVRRQVSAISVGKAHPTKFVWERFATAIKVDPPQADSMFDAYSPPLEDWMFDAYSPPLEDSTFISFFPSIKPAAVLAGGPPEAEHLTPGT